jgi:hypothetical protein
VAGAGGFLSPGAVDVIWEKRFLVSAGNHWSYSTNDCFLTHSVTSISFVALKSLANYLLAIELRKEITTDCITKDGKLFANLT